MIIFIGYLTLMIITAITGYFMDLKEGNKSSFIFRLATATITFFVTVFLLSNL